MLAVGAKARGHETGPYQGGSRPECLIGSDRGLTWHGLKTRGEPCPDETRRIDASMNVRSFWTRCATSSSSNRPRPARGSFRGRPGAGAELDIWPTDRTLRRLSYVEPWNCGSACLPGCGAAPSMCVLSISQRSNGRSRSISSCRLTRIARGRREPARTLPRKCRWSARRAPVGGNLLCVHGCGADRCPRVVIAEYSLIVTSQPPDVLSNRGRDVRTAAYAVASCRCDSETRL